MIPRPPRKGRPSLLLLAALIFAAVYFPQRAFSARYDGLFLARDTDDSAIEVCSGTILLEGKRSYFSGFEGSIRIERDGQIVYQKNGAKLSREKDYVLVDHDPEAAVRQDLICVFMPTSYTWDAMCLTGMNDTLCRDGDTRYLFFCGPASNVDEAIAILEKLQLSGFADLFKN